MFTSLRLALIAILFVTGIASAFATGADARDRHRHRRHHDGFDLGDAIIGAAVLGAIIGIANSGKKDRDERRGTPLPPAPYPEDRYPEERYPDDRERRTDDGWTNSDGWARIDPRYADRFPSERAAVQSCAREAEDLGSRYGADARVSLIEDVAREGRDYRVTGTIDSSDAGDRQSFSRFTCFAEDGRVTGFRFG